MRLRPDAQRPKGACTTWTARYTGCPSIGDEHIARLYSGALAWGTMSDVKRLNAVLSVEPGYAIVGNVKGKALLEIDDSEDDGCHGEKHQEQLRLAGTRRFGFDLSLRGASGQLAEAITPKSSTFFTARYEFL